MNQQGDSFTCPTCCVDPSISRCPFCCVDPSISRCPTSRPTQLQQRGKRTHLFAWAMLHSMIFLSSVLFNEPEVFTSSVVLTVFFYSMAMLQSMLTTTAGAWQQYEAAMTDLRTPQPTSVYTTSTMELYYLRHCRSCAAAASGNKGGSYGQSNPLMMSGAFVFGVMLQQMCTMLLSLLQPVFRLIRLSWRMGRHATKSLLKLTITFLAMLQSALELAQEVTSAWLSPLELAACLHLASFDIHRSVHSVHCEPDHCWCTVLTGPSPHEMSTIAIALVSLLLALLDWHVPPITCRILTAMCMHALRPDRAWIVMALLWPTFGKRSQDQRSAPRKRTTKTSPATEQTGDNSMTPTTESNEQSMDTVPEGVSPELDSNDATTASSHAIESLDDVIAHFRPRQGEGEAFQTLYAHAQKVQNASQQQIRDMCKPYGVALTAKKEGKWPKRLNVDLKRDIQAKLIERARVLNTRPAITARGDATGRAESESTAAHGTSDASSSQLAMNRMASTSDPRTATSSSMKLPDFRNLFDKTDAAITAMMNWAHANATHRPVAAWLEAC